MPRVAKTTRRAAPGRPAAWRLLLRRARRFTRPVLLACAVLGLIGVIALALRGHSSATVAGGSLAGRGEWFGRLTAGLGLRVETVVIEGRSNTPEPLVRAALGVARGDPLYGVSLDAARARLESLAWVQRAEVARDLPGTIVVRLTERRPFAVWQSQGRFTLIDRAGREVADEGVANFKTLPLVVGANAPAHTAEILDLLEKYPTLRARVVALVRVGGRRWTLHLGNGTDVLLPEGHDAAALARLMQLQTAHDLLDRRLAIVDLRAPDRLVLRAFAEPAPALSAPTEEQGTARGDAAAMPTPPIPAPVPAPVPAPGGTAPTPHGENGNSGGRPA